jgi:hypothetical protein
MNETEKIQTLEGLASMLTIDGIQSAIVDLVAFFALNWNSSHELPMRSYLSHPLTRCIDLRTFTELLKHQQLKPGSQHKIIPVSVSDKSSVIECKILYRSLVAPRTIYSRLADEPTEKHLYLLAFIKASSRFQGIGGCLTPPDMFSLEGKKPRLISRVLNAANFMDRGIDCPKRE